MLVPERHEVGSQDAVVAVTSDEMREELLNPSLDVICSSERCLDVGRSECDVVHLACDTLAQEVGSCSLGYSCLWKHRKCAVCGVLPHAG